MTRSWTILILAAVAVAGCGGRTGPLFPGMRAPAGESLVERDGTSVLLPATRLAHPELDECSGMVWLNGSFWAHNDSGDDPVLFRASTPEFADAVEIPVPGARARDWEEIAVDGDDLLIFDFGDNRRERDDCVIYRVRPTADGVRLLAVYPMAFPDAPHDAEAAIAVDGRVTIVTKARTEPETFVYRFDELVAGEPNVPRRTATLDLQRGEAITAADYDPKSRSVVLLTYGSVLRYPISSLSGPPRMRTRLWARQCESLCVVEDDLIITNEERDVFVVRDYRNRGGIPWVPPRLEFDLSLDGTPVAVPMRSEVTGQPMGDLVNLTARGRELAITFALSAPDGVPTTNVDPFDPGGLLLVMVGRGGPGHATDRHRVFAVGLGPSGAPGVWSFNGDEGRGGIRPERSARIEAVEEDGTFVGRLIIPFDRVFGLGRPLEFVFDARTVRLGDENRFASGYGLFSMYRPYTWCRVRLTSD